MKNKIFIATSLDGFIADDKGSVDWLNEIPQSEDAGNLFSEFMESIDALIMGRKTFETVHSFGVWPYTKPVIVLSRTIKDLPDSYENKATISNEDINSLMQRLQNEGFQNLYIDGGKVIQDFLSMDLIDEMIITRVPVLLGDGIALFGKLNHKMQFKHVETKTFENGLVVSTYHRDK